jgi:hypothetical protein
MKRRPMDKEVSCNVLNKHSADKGCTSSLFVWDREIVCITVKKQPVTNVTQDLRLGPVPCGTT